MVCQLSEVRFSYRVMECQLFWLEQYRPCHWLLSFMESVVKFIRKHLNGFVRKNISIAEYIKFGTNIWALLTEREILYFSRNHYLFQVEIHHRYLPFKRLKRSVVDCY
jgi:hypothetical protein